MNVTEVTMEPEAAAAAFKEYRAAFMAERNRIDGELMRGYKALAEGKTLISLGDAISKAGCDEMGRPQVAIARADERAVQMQRTKAGAITYWPANTRATAGDRRFDLPDGTVRALTDADPKSRWGDPLATNRWFATLPFIPPQYRPPHGLVNYHLLWEAEWRSSFGPQRRDPLLLKHIGGQLFAVLAAWDLTEVEKLVLAR